jgi:hypothetical protein
MLARVLKDDFITYLAELNKKGIYNPYLDKGYSLSVHDTLKPLPCRRYLQGTSFYMGAGDVSLVFRTWSIVTAVDLTYFFLQQGYTHHKLNDLNSEVEIFEYLWFELETKGQNTLRLT